MANIPIRDMTQSGVPSASSLVVFDDGTMKKGTVGSMADAVRPVASQGEAETGSDNAKTMTPLRVKQSLASEVNSTVQAHSANLDNFAGKAAPTGVVVGTTDAQTLTNKTLTAPAISSPTGLVKADVGLNNVDNTSDANKPISTATQTALNNKQDGDSDLTAIAALSGTGLIARTGSGTAATRTITGSNGLSITNGDGVSGNPSGSIDINGLTADPTPDGSADYVMTYDASATANKKVLLNNLPGGGGGGGVSSLNGLTGAVTLYGPPQGRITVTSGVAAPTSSVTSATTYYYTPSGGNMVVIYDGTKLVPYAFTELSQTTTDTTRAPAAVTTNSNYDLYIGLSGGVPALFRSPAWSSNTSRGTGAGTAEQVRLSNGVIVNAQAITNGPAAQRGTYVGTIRTNGSSAVNYIIGGSASGGTAGDMGVWNMYNRVLSVMTVKDSGAQYSYAAGARQARASAGNQASIVVGLVEDAIVATYQSRIDTAATATTFGYIGIGYDSTSIISSATVYIQTVANALQFGSPITEINHYPTLGYHSYVALEGAGGTCSFNGSSDATLAVKVWN